MSQSTSKNTLIKEAHALVKNNKQEGANAILAFIEEKGFILKKEEIKKQTSAEHKENPELTIQTTSEYYYNQNKEGIFLYIHHCNDGTYHMHMRDHKRHKTFSAYKHPAGYPLGEHHITKLETIDPHKRSTPEDLKFLYGFDYTI